MKLFVSALLFSASTVVVEAGRLRSLAEDEPMPKPDEDSFDEPMIDMVDGGSEAATLVDCPPAVMEARKPMAGDNVCQDTNPKLPLVECYIDAIAQTGEQTGINVTMGYQGLRDTDAVPLTQPFWEAGLCPVNIHWHIGAEHLSEGEYDWEGTSPPSSKAEAGRVGPKCHYYDPEDPMYTTEYDWQYCTDTFVGETYEVHWPHSAAGACGTPNQYQTPFYDGVFCHGEKLVDTAAQVGVQAQVFTIVNDEDYFYPNMFQGMIVDGEYGADIVKYTGSTTGAADNEMCQQYAPISWHVDRKCHLISASAFDKMCMEMMSQRDDMSADVYPHGSRPIATDDLAANNLIHNRKLGGRDRY